MVRFDTIKVTSWKAVRKYIKRLLTKHNALAPRKSDPDLAEELLFANAFFAENGAEGQVAEAEDDHHPCTEILKFVDRPSCATLFQKVVAFLESNPKQVMRHSNTSDHTIPFVSFTQ